MVYSALQELSSQLSTLFFDVTYLHADLLNPWDSRGMEANVARFPVGVETNVIGFARGWKNCTRFLRKYSYFLLLR